MKAFMYTPHFYIVLGFQKIIIIIEIIKKKINEVFITFRYDQFLNQIFENSL